MTARAGPLDASVRRAIRGRGAAVAAVRSTRWWPSTPRPWATTGRAAAARGLLEQLVGLGPLAQLAADPSVTDLLVNGDGAVWVDRGDGVERDRGAGAGSTTCGRSPCGWPGWPAAGSTTPSRGSTACCPVVCGCTPCCRPWPTAGRTSACGSPGTAPAASTPWCGSVPRPPDMATVLRAVVAARASLVVTGGTGAGKTTVLAALVAECPADERVVVVEDVRELDPDHPHVVRLQGRGPNVEGVGGVTLVDLVRQALRMRPDRLVVGEVRGAEVRELLAALNTGHEGGMSTLHANGPEEVPARFEALGALAGMPRQAVHAQLREALRVVVHVVRRDGRRRVDRVGVVVPDPAEPGAVRVVEAASSGDGRSRRRARAASGWSSWCRRSPPAAGGWRAC